MDNSVLVSVIMATYNSATLLPMSIESIIAQTYPNWELIIIDDGSVDDTKKVLKRYQETDERIIVLGNNKNLGLAASLNIAIKAAKGDFIARMDSDDFSFPQRLETQLNFFVKNQDINVLGTGIEAINEEGCFTEYRCRPEVHKELSAKIFYENPFYHSTVMAKRLFFENSGGYDPRLRRCQDYDLWLRTYRSFRFHNIQEPLVRYRVRDSVSWQSVRFSALVLLRAMRRESVLARNWLIAFRGPLRKLLKQLQNSTLLLILSHIYQRRKRTRLKIQ